MQFAIVDGTRRQAFPNGRGHCPLCEADVIAKCGSRVIHHWAHARDALCDPWWENETAWHREWKDCFPENCREVIHLDEVTGEIHRADIKTPSGIVVEVQNSPLNEGEQVLREAFYKNMVWVVNGAAFRDQFHILHMLPDPASEIAQDLRWFWMTRKSAEGMFWRPSENPDYLVGKTRMVEVHSIREIQHAIQNAYSGHHQYDWVRSRWGWLTAGCPVYLDFGKDVLWRLEHYDGSGLPCVRAVAKRKFIHDAMTEQYSVNIATRFYPIS